MTPVRLGRISRLAALVALAACPWFAAPQAASAAPTYATTVRTLWAGRHTPVGSVTVTRDDSALNVVYAISADGWALDATHLYVGVKPPKKAAPGSFPFQHRLRRALRDEYRIPWCSVGARVVDCVVVAAHADVARRTGSHPDEDALSRSPSDLASFWVVGPGATTYMDVHLTGDDLDGVYPGWCADLSHHIDANVVYSANVVSSYDPRALDIVDKPDNLDLLNWVIAHADEWLQAGVWWRSIQEAIWRLVDDGDPQFLGDPDEVAAILENAAAQGEGFVPGCDGSFALFLEPVGDCGGRVAQLTVIPMPLARYGVRCLGCWHHESAWAFAEGDSRLKNCHGRPVGWGRWFTACP